MDTNKIEELVEWFRTYDGGILREMDREEYFVTPLMEAFGEDASEILNYLNNMKIEELREISGIFEDIYRKFTTDEVYDALGKLEEKIA